jgi:TonB family protein
VATGGAGSGGAYPGTAALRAGSADGGGASRSGLALAGGQGAATALPAGMRAVSGGHGGTGGGAASGSGSGHASPGMDQDGARLVTIKVADRQIMRADSQLQALDVLAPSIYCPLPLPGHSFPDNRPPKPDVQLTSQPAYAPDNPSFIFPIQAWAGNIQGKAIVRVEVQPDGKPGRMWLKQSSGSGLLDRDAQSQLTFWRFIPARKNGQPVTAWIDVPVVYRLQDAKK